MKLKEKYYVKIVPARGDAVHRFELTRARIVVCVAGAIVAIVGSLALAGVQVAGAHAETANLRRQTGSQGAALQAMGRQADRLRKQLQSVQRENDQVRQLMGVRVVKPPVRKALRRTSQADRPRGAAALLASRLARLSAASAQAKLQIDDIRSLAMRVLNVRHIAEFSRARLIAAIPSIDPVSGAAVVGCFCYRTSPDVEFHEGVDLGADEGAAVRAAAAGTVAAAGWDGSYGQKIVVDHGNGYQTWYAHLSRIDVTAGEHVFKSETIGQVGETGFATGPHLHYQVMLDGRPVDPDPYLRGVPANVLAALP